MTETPSYFLVRYSSRLRSVGFTAYAAGTMLLRIPDLAQCRIIRMFPYPSVDLTHRLSMLQRRWRQRLAERRWFGHPLRLLAREREGRFPPLPLRRSLPHPPHRRPLQTLEDSSV